MNRLKYYIPMIIIILLTLVFFYKLSFTNLILARGDTYTYFYPYWDARNMAMAMGDLPLWASDIFMGVPLLANPQIGTFYPPNWLTIPLSAPDAIRMSILLHIIWSALGVFVLFRQTISKSLLPAFVVSLVFALSGYISAHIEQINQLQGLSWLPWLLYLYHQAHSGGHRLRWGVLLALGWTLQIFSGHTQTVFMTGIALGIYALSLSEWDKPLKSISKNLAFVAFPAIIAVLLALPQLLPTLELTGMSNREGGFDANQATAFSLPPTYLGRALLPSYDGQLFTEYIGYIGVIALGLAIYGAIIMIPTKPRPYVWIVLAGIGLLFAMGRYTGIYWYIASLPGFNLFRVPARWLAFYALGMSMLSGYGLLALQTYPLQKKRALVACFALLTLMLIARFVPVSQVDIVGSAQPTLMTLGLWGIAFFILLGLFFIPQRKRVVLLGAIVITVELFLSAQVLPYNDLAPREVYLGQRFTISQMLAFNQQDLPSSRMLSISGRLFDTGDRATLQARFSEYGLDTIAQQTTFTAIKSQEILFPNLGLTWGIPTIDGYGGGVLPTIYYSQFTSLLLPDDSLRTVDGRIGEMLSEPDCRGACIPTYELLQFMDTQYIITDKNFDLPYNGIFYDTSLAEYWQNIPQEPTVSFDTISVLLRDPLPEIESETFDFLGTSYYLVSVSWDEFIDILNTHHELVLGASAVNTVTNTFNQLTPTGFERVLSSDIKIYRLDNAGRAGLASTIVITPDNWEGHESALDILRDNPTTLVVHDAPQLDGTDSGSVEIVEYSDTVVRLTVNSDSETYLYLADAYYPGWRATVNGEDVEVYRANVMFRAVAVPAGESEVIFEFVPRLWYRAMTIGGIAWILVSVLLFGLFLRKE
ncbi:MAG: hypothetical protein Phog2KO_24750 [Phototrophicaceae bacterium]